MIRITIIVLVLMFASGCAQKYCEREASYQQAQEYPALSAPAGLEAPKQDPNMQIPQAQGDSSTVLGESRRCLEIPPRMREGA